MRSFLGVLYALSLLGRAEAQTTTFVVTGDINTAGPVYQVANSAGSWRLEYLAPNPQTTTVPTDRFAYVDFGTFRVTQTGTYTLPPTIPFRLLIAQQGTSPIGTFAGTIFTSGIPTLPYAPRILFDNAAPTTLGGVHYSTLDSSITLTPPTGVNTLDVPIRGQLTRGGIVWDQDSVTFEVAPNSSSNQALFPLRLPEGSTMVETYVFDFVATGGTATQGRVYGQPVGGLGNFRGTFRAIGVPPRTMPILIRALTPTVGFFATPDEMTFRYQKGDPNPPTQYIDLRTVGTGIGSFDITSSLYDGNWISIASIPPLAPRSSALVAVVPNMTSKNVGFHNTNIVFRWGDQIREVRVNFEVYDQPGSLTLTSTTGGTVKVDPALPSYPNGTRVRITATPDRYYRFAGWRGSSLRTSQEFIVNGPMTFEAQFVFAGAEAACVPTLAPNIISAPPEGDAGRIDVQIDRACSWQVTGLPAWMRLNATSSNPDTGSYLSYAIDPNPAATARLATIQVGGVPLLVEQAAPACAGVRAFPPAALPFTSSPFFSLLQTRPADCTEPLRTAGSWLTTTAFDTNPNFTPRTAVAYSGGSRVPVIQQGRWAPSPFADVSFNHPAAAAVGVLKSLDATDSCGANQFCPDAGITRADVARFLVMASIRNASFPSSQTPLFTDVPLSHPQFRWIQKLAELGIAQGCGNGRYCPDRLVTRAELAAFLARAGARVGPGAFLYPPSTPYFQDVPASSPFFAPIQKMRQWGVSIGCSDTGYCPNGVATRSQVATMIVRALVSPSE